jgi:tripartite-type tricarboxylate transporter receptor subunit TctC
VRVIVPFPPGAGVDIVTRSVSPKLGELLVQQLIVDNRAGAVASWAQSWPPKRSRTDIRC